MMFYDGNMPVSQYEPPNCVSMRGVLGNVFFVVLLGRPRSSYVNNGIQATSGFGIHCVRLSLSALFITKPHFLQCKTHFFCFSFTVFSCFLCPFRSSGEPGL